MGRVESVVRAWLLGCMVACAAGDDVDPDDTDVVPDTDGVPDTDVVPDTDGVPDTDVDTEDGFPVYTPVEPVERFVRITFEDRAVVSYLPEDPEGVLFVFHGTGGDASVAESTEMVAVLNAMIAEGIGFVAVSAADQPRGVFDDAASPASNEDWQHTVALREQLLAEERITASTPVHALGYSGGGGFASYVGHAGLAAGWPMGGLDIMHSGAQSRKYGGLPALPVVATGAVHDELVEADVVRRLVERHVDDGEQGLFLLHDEQPLAPTRFARTPFINERRSRELVGIALREGFIDEAGLRTFPAAEIEAQIEVFANRPDTDPDKPIRAVLGVVFATHAINGEHAVREAAFLAGAR